jgi:hypothetical protein
MFGTGTSSVPRAGWITSCLWLATLLLFTTSCAEDPNKQIADKPIEIRTASDLREYLVGRWKTGPDELSGVVVTSDSLLIVDEDGELADSRYNEKIEFLDQSRLRFDVGIRIEDLTPADPSNEDRSMWSNDRGEYHESIEVVNILSPNRIRWWADPPEEWDTYRVDGRYTLHRAATGVN